MAIVDGWVTWAERREAPEDKVYSAANQGRGLALHSAEGSIAGAEARLRSSEREVDGRYTRYAAASWMFFLRAGGGLVQYYPVTASTWSSGNAAANTSLWAVEAEGLASETLTGGQVATLLRLVDEWEAHTGRSATRDEPCRTLWEHREVWDWATPNAGPTACPSGRYEPLYRALAGRQPVDRLRRDLDDLKAVLLGNGIDVRATERTLDLFPPETRIGDQARLVGDDAFRYAVRQEFSVTLAVLRLAERVAALERDVGRRPKR
ncbi:MAG: hypothetical protein Kow0010_26380 [Dehalococcoidia bacterium]